jgi:predicted RNA-binding protein with RPS1 domain
LAIHPYPARSVTKTRKKSNGRGRSDDRRWSARVTKQSNALDLEAKVFRSTSPRKIALSLKRSAERSKRRKAKPYQSAMSMLNFYINRAGKNLPRNRKRILQRAKDELRDLFGRA